MAEPRILGPDGRPLERQALVREVAAPTLTGLRSAWSLGVIAAGLTPQRLAQVLRGAAEGDMADYLTLAEEMEERDLHYRAVLGQRKLAVSGLEPVVESASDEPRDLELADAVRTLVAAPAFSELVDDLLDALGKGFSAAEIMWLRGARWAPRAQVVDGRAVQAYEWRDPHWFVFDRTDGRTLRLLDASAPEGVALPPYKFIVHHPRLKSGLPIRGGLARLAAFAFMVKNWTLKDWLAFADVYGLPLRIGRYDVGTPKEEVDKLLQAVAGLGSDAAAVISRGMEIEIQQAPVGAGGGPLFQGLAEWVDRQVSKGVLGQTMTTDDGSSLGQAKVHDGVREDILRADAKALAATLNRDLVRPFVDLNFGPQERYPCLRLPVPEPEDLAQLVTALKELVPLGLRVEQSVIRDRLRLPDPDPAAKPEDLLTAAPASALAANARQTCPAHGVALNRAGPGDALDTLAAEALADWQPLMRPVVDPLRTLAAACRSADEFRARLPELLAEIDATALVDALAGAAFRARGLGDATDTL